MGCLFPGRRRPGINSFLLPRRNSPHFLQLTFAGVISRIFQNAKKIFLFLFFFKYNPDSSLLGRETPYLPGEGLGYLRPRGVSDHICINNTGGVK